MKKIYATLLGAGLILSPFGGAYAASLAFLGLNYSNQSTVDLDASVDTNIDTSVDTSVIEADANADSDAGLNVSTDAETDANASNNGTIGATVDSERVDDTLESAISVTRDAEFSGSTENSVMVAADTVSTENDLRAYAESELRANANIDALNFDTDTVEVRYKDHGRFVGIIPVMIDVDVTVHQDGEVEVDYPWYGFLVAKNGDDLRMEIEAAVQATLSANVDGGWTHYDRALLAESIIATLEAHYEADESVTSTDESSSE